MDIPDDIKQKIEIVYDKRDDKVPIRCKLKSTPEECDVCNRVVQGRKIFIRKVQTPFPRWSQSCNLCKKAFNSVTGEWCTEPELRQFLRDYNKDR